jgi:hypothetical protein
MVCHLGNVDARPDRGDRPLATGRSRNRRGGVHPEVIVPVIDHPEIHPDWKIMVCRAMQFIAIKRVADRRAGLPRQGVLL